MRWPDGFPPRSRPRRVDGGLKARSGRGAIGESWWSKRFLAVLESLALGARLARGRSYARAGQVLSLQVAPGKVTASVQGSRATPYRVGIGLAAFDAQTWRMAEAALAAQALYSARLLAGEMPAQIEEVFASAGVALFPTGADQLTMSCSCPDWRVPCKHIAATFYLLAEAFDADPFQILLWRGRDRSTLLARLRELRSGSAGAARSATTRARAGRRPVPSPAGLTGPAAAVTGAGAALAGLAGPDLDEIIDRFWVAPVPLPPRPSTLDTDIDLLLRQLPSPPPEAGGVELVHRLRDLYARLSFPS